MNSVRDDLSGTHESREVCGQAMHFSLPDLYDLLEEWVPSRRGRSLYANIARNLVAYKLDCRLRVSSAGR